MGIRNTGRSKFLFRKSQMIFISHRGNINGITRSLENKPSYIDLAIENGYDVEIDFWLINDIGCEILYLGHDKPEYKIQIDWLIKRKSKLWIHCKNYESIVFLSKISIEFNYFWHENDKCTLTSKGFIWSFPNINIDNSVSVLPEIHDEKNLNNRIGICSDFIYKYKLDYEF